jgi:hypothetical protein
MYSSIVSMDSRIQNTESMISLYVFFHFDNFTAVKYAKSMGDVIGRFHYNLRNNPVCVTGYGWFCQIGLFGFGGICINGNAGFYYKIFWQILRLTHDRQC